MMIYVFAERRNLKIWLGAMALVLAVHFLLVRIVYPGFSISPGNINEMLSVPIQQTARYMQIYPDEITQDEKESIDRMWNYDELLENYEPDKSDVAKATFRLESSVSDWNSYFITWMNIYRLQLIIIMSTSIREANWLKRIPLNTE